MKLNAIQTALLLSLVPTTTTFAAALDRSGQSIAAFLQPNNYFEAGITVLDPNVSGKDISQNNTGDMANHYYSPNAALKIQATEHFSIGLIYDQPYGADAQYTGQSNFIENRPLPFQGGTSVTVDTENLNLLFGYQPNQNWNVYAGAVYQTLDATVLLRGASYSAYSGYDFKTGRDEAVGWLAGVAYQIPEIALKTSLTYRAKIKHEMNAYENHGIAGFTGSPVFDALLNQINNAQGTTEITTPQSVNLDFQTGIMENTVAFANVRWVNWKDFAIRPYKFGAASVLPPIVNKTGKKDGFDLVAYTDDQYSVTAGVGRKVNDHWAGNVSVGWDSGAGNPVTTLGPTEGYWNVGVGVQYSPAPNYFIAGGVKYFWLGDAKAQSGSQFNTPEHVAEFKNNDAIAYGLKIGYKF
ncbi:MULTISPECIES: OmpP1/FadL family transporter [Acinetobacter]|uniref:OmpP1/FadL family transporter n=1 Tax=Acinetobacter TaxID=469 RepID=UPI000C46D214|nr:MULTISPECIES: outer membrane protein transport protein [Acinetobacter]MBT50938.1 transporter [Acinetobacter sp.]HIQ33833.1 transporter [Acinetobacter venetianus]HJP48181.1 outer membrane protein transport protein [Acinetobacter venetianus]